MGDWPQNEDRRECSTDEEAIGGWLWRSSLLGSEGIRWSYPLRFGAYS